MTLAGTNRKNSIDILHASAARTASGSVAIAADSFVAADTLIIELRCTVASGTTPTLDVTVEDSIDGTNFFNVATFAQLVGTGSEVKRITIPFTDTLRIAYAIGGTTPSFTFSVKAFAKVA